MAFEQLKERQSVMWGAGPFEVIEDTIADLHEVIVDRLQPRSGERWIDVGCGTGGLAERAARAGAEVTGVDLAPALMFHRAWVDYFEQNHRRDGGIEHPREYLLVLGTRR